jgi:hypothetical protein
VHRKKFRIFEKTDKSSRQAKMRFCLTWCCKKHGFLEVILARVLEKPSLREKERA